MRLQPVRSLVAAACASISVGTFAQSEPPQGPPWAETCAPMEQPSFRQIFTSDQCQIDFEAVVQASTTDAAAAWMHAHRECFHEWLHFTWLSFLRHDPKMAALGWRHQLAIIKERLIGATACNDEACLEGEIKGLLARGLAGTVSAEAVAHTATFLDAVDQDGTYSESMQKAKDAATPICLYHLDVACIGAMTQTLTWMYPRMFKLDGPPPEHFTFSMVPFFREIFTDATTQQYASQLALDLFAAGNDPAGGAVGDETIYTLGLRDFHGDADRFWKFMIVYATRGAAWGAASDLAHADTRPLFAAFMVISAAMGNLDTAAIAHGKAFSYGPDTTTTCFEPKPYHYWMSAGYVYLLKQLHYSDRTARLVSRLLGAMYELGSTTMDRDPNAVFFVPEFATIVNRTRRELAHHSLGADFALAAPAPQDFDARFGAFLANSLPLPDLSAEAMQQKLQDLPTKWQMWSKLTGFYFDQQGATTF